MAERDLSGKAEDPGAVARRLLGFDELRPGQEPAMKAVLRGHDVLAVLPTGAGKSAIYQVAASVLPGPTVVVSPLIALQRDQADKLEDPAAGGAAVVNSTIATAVQREAFADLEEDALEFIFLAPEQLQRREVLARLRESRPSLFVVDEAHCISEWGHDFRPDYLRLGAVIEALDHPRVLALTATAAAPVREEIIERLGMDSPHVIVGDLDRPNIRLGVRACPRDVIKREELLDAVQAAPKPGIVYVATRRHAEEVAAELTDVGVRAVWYHGGMDKRERDQVQREFMSGDADVIVATSAFGMGIDKPDVRFVYHFDVPASLDAYYQEVGRAGRDGEPAEALLFYRPEDLNLHKFFAGGGRLRPEELAEVADAVRAAGPTDLGALRVATSLSRGKLAQAVAELEAQGLVEQAADGALKAAPGDADLDTAADGMRRRQEGRRARLLRNLERMRAYAELRDCRRQYLLEHFGQASEPCGRCDNCEAGLPEPDEGEDEPFPRNTRVCHSTLGKGTVLGYEQWRITILFDASGEKTLDVRFALARDLLRRP